MSTGQHGYRLPLIRSDMSRDSLLSDARTAMSAAL